MKKFFKSPLSTVSIPPYTYLPTIYTLKSPEAPFLCLVTGPQVYYPLSEQYESLQLQWLLWGVLILPRKLPHPQTLNLVATQSIEYQIKCVCFSLVNLLSVRKYFLSCILYFCKLLDSIYSYYVQNFCTSVYEKYNAPFLLSL